MWIPAAVLPVGAGGYFAYHAGAAIAGNQRSDALVGIGALVLIGAALFAVRAGVGEITAPDRGTAGSSSSSALDQDDREDDKDG